MNKQSDQIFLACVIAMWVLSAIFFIDCLFNTLENLEILGASMLAIKPSFSVDSLLSKTRKYGESSHNRNFCGLHTPIYRVINFAQDFILQHRISRDFMMNTSRGQAKWIVQHNDALSIHMAFGYSAVKIGARTIFAVDENTRTIYHIDSKGRLAVTDYYQDYDMTDVNAQVAEVLEVIAEHYSAEKYKAIDDDAKQYEWQLMNDTCEFVERTEWERATVKVWGLTWSKSSVEWERQYGRINRNGSVSYKTETGKYPKAYKVAIGDVVAWVPHSILSRRTTLHGGRVMVHPGDDYFLGCVSHVQPIDLPVWWLEKTVGLDWSDKVAPLGRDAYFKMTKPKRRWRR